jgi:ABC-type antimicrobial peptide transport system permease subunit
LNDGDAVELYHAAQLSDMPGMVVVVKTAGASDGLMPMAKSTGESIDPKLFLYIRLLKAEFRRSTTGAKNVALVVSLLGMIALSLATLGLVGLVAYAVSDRTKEIAIRIALGATPWNVLSVILSQFFWPIVLGLLAGAAGTAALSKLLRQGLYGVSHLDPVSYAGAVGFLLVVTIAATLIPAERALRVNPTQALHAE